ncbi:MAG: O-antigen ligase family protein [Acidobacteriota bacterium]
MNTNRFEQAGVVALIGAAGAIQFSIAIGQILAAVACACWLAVVVTNHEPLLRAPRMFWPLAVYAALTLVSAAFSPQPYTSFIDCKQLVLFLLVPVTYRLMNESRAHTLVSVVMSLGAVSAVFGIIQYGILHYDTLGQRPQGTLSHYMTYSGLLMLVIGIALARILFGRRERTWAALIMPALLVAISLTQTRNAWMGVLAAVALLLSLKDFRLLAVLPLVAAIFFGIAPTRFMSIFDRNNPTSRDRVAMIEEGGHMILDHPLVGVGPNMVQQRYADYRVSTAVEKVNPHLHNVPVQIAAERGLPALAAWIVFVVMLFVDLCRGLRFPSERFFAAVGLASVVAMLAAGLFEYNFGDSEFLMSLLILVTLPFAVRRSNAENLELKPRN